MLLSERMFFWESADTNRRLEKVTMIRFERVNLTMTVCMHLISTNQADYAGLLTSHISASTIISTTHEDRIEYIHNLKERMLSSRHLMPQDEEAKARCNN